ncbi:RHS repeat-associated core domain-containing protein [Chloroflexi bacterium TSY]|nr:RHS repeat-associated core domain-containing protein [Chloroflexi bacterium TSY]
MTPKSLQSRLKIAKNAKFGSTESDKVLFVNTRTIARTPNVADGATDIGKGDLTPNDSQPIPGVTGVSILGRVSVRTEYDRNSRQTFTIEDDGDTTRLFYDGADRVVKTIDAEGNVVETAYDDNDNVIEVQETDVAQISGVPAELFVTTYFYDSLNRLQRRVDNIGQTVDYRYDSRDNLVATSDAQGPLSGATISRRVYTGGAKTRNQINGFGNVTRMSYDGINRKTRAEQVLTASGEGDGQQIGVDLFGVPTVLPVPDTNQGGGDGLITLRYGYDGNSLLARVTDDNGNQTEYAYDNLDRQVRETKGECVPPALADHCDAPTTITNAYDPDDNLVRTVDENGSVIDYLYDAVNRLRVLTVDRGSGVLGTTEETYAYDGLSRLVRATDNNNPEEDSDDSTITLAYDSLSRIIEETQQVGQGTPKVVSSAWRSAQLRSRLTYPNGRILGYTYDKLDRMQSIQSETGGQVATRHHYLPLFVNKTTARVSQSQPRRRPLDPGTTMLPPVSEIVRYKYIGQERVFERVYANGTRMTYLDDAGGANIGYDGVRRAVQMRHLRDDGSTVVGFGHTYDRMNNKLTQETLHAPTESELYRYDSVYRLIQFQRGTLTSAQDDVAVPSANAPLHSDWTLDGLGNWQQVDDESREHSSINEIVLRDNGDPVTIVSDENGNQTDDGTYLLTWDYRNRLRTVRRQDDGTPIAVYVYDAQGRRIRKSVTTAETLDRVTHYYYDQWQVVEERDGADTLTQQYVYGGLYIDEVVLLDRNLTQNARAIDPNDQRLYLHQNRHFSVYALTDSDGAIVEGYQYDAYGRQTLFAPGPNGVLDFGGDDLVTMGAVSQVGNPYLYTGRRLDGETGFYYYRHRYLNTEQGRFISRDPLGYQHGNPLVTNGEYWVLNLYGYVSDRPTKHLDPSGLRGIDVVVTPLNDASLKKERERLVKAAPHKGYGYFSYQNLDNLLTFLKKMAPKAGYNCIRTLEIKAHANPYTINGIKGANIRSFAQRLSKEVKWCCPCSIYLSGCNTGLKSAPIAQALANATNCTAYGSVGYLRGTHMEGNEDTDREVIYQGHKYEPYDGSKEAKGNDVWKPIKPGSSATGSSAAGSGKGGKGGK